MPFYSDLKKYYDRTAIMDDRQQSISYGTLNKFCENIGLHLKKRTLVFSFCENSIGSIAGYVAFLNNGVVPVLLDAHVEKELRDNLLAIYQPDYLYFPREMSGEFAGQPCIYDEWGYCLCENPEKKEHRLYEGLALLLTTSGSTGSPKFVRQSYHNIQVNAESIAEYLEIDDTERPVTTLPMSYTYGLSIINSHLLRGGTILATKYTLMQREFWNFFKECGATSFGGVPYTYEMLKKLRFFRMDLPSLRTMTQAGGKLAPELHREFAEYAREKGKKFVVMYGQCEATARMAYLPADRALEKYGSMGIAIPGGTLELIDAERNVIEEPDVVGELVYTGENVTLGYAETAADLEKGDERFGRLETGDMAKRDEDGYYFIVGRKKRFLKIYGNRVNLDETERMIRRFDEDLACACAGVDDHLYVFLENASEEKAGSVRQFLSEKTGLHPSAFTVRQLDKIPKNEAGKTLYGKLKEYYDGV